MTVPKNSLILVADGAKTLFLRNLGQNDAISLITEAHKERIDRSTTLDVRGATTQGDGHGRHRVEESDFQQLDEERFAATVAEQLRLRALAGDFEALVLIAPSKILGALHMHLDGEVERRIVMELAKDMTSRPLPDIAAMLMGRNQPTN